MKDYRETLRRQAAAVSQQTSIRSVRVRNTEKERVRKTDLNYNNRDLYCETPGAAES